MAEVLVTMLNADVSVLPWEKPALFSPTPPDGLTALDRPAYYSSREVKELGKEAIKIRNSRSTGVLLTDGGIFIIYNTGPGQMKWEYKAEMRFQRPCWRWRFVRPGSRPKFKRAVQTPIVFGIDMGQMPL